MTESRKFSFAREFKAAPGRIVPLEQKEATLTLSEHRAALVAAAAAAEAEGRRQGQDSARQEETARLARAIEALAAALDQVRADLGRIDERAAGEAVRFAEIFARKLAGDLVSREPMAAIEAVARGIFGDLRGQAHVALRVAPDLVEPARTAVGVLAREHGFDGRLIVLGEPEIPPGDARIEWADGGIVREQANVEALIAAAVRRALEAPVAADATS